MKEKYLYLSLKILKKLKNMLKDSIITKKMKNSLRI